MVTQSELAKALGASTRTLDRWARAGMPVLEERGARKRLRYNLVACREWASSRPTQGRHPTQDKARPPVLGPLTPAERLATARATDLEIKLHQRRGNLLTKSEVEAEWTRQGRVAPYSKSRPRSPFGIQESRGRGDVPAPDYRRDEEPRGKLQGAAGMIFYLSGAAYSTICIGSPLTPPRTSATPRARPARA